MKKERGTVGSRLYNRFRDLVDPEDYPKFEPAICEGCGEPFSYAPEEINGQVYCPDCARLYE